MEYDKYQGYKIRLKDAIEGLEKVSNSADTAAKNAIHSMEAYLDADSEDKVSTGSALDGYLRVLNQKTTDAKNVREYFYTQLNEIREECKDAEKERTNGGKKHTRRHKKKRGKKTRATRSKHY